MKKTSAVITLLLSITLIALRSGAVVATDFATTMADVRAAADREQALLSTGGQLKVLWEDDYLLYMPDLGRYTIDLVDLRSNARRRIVEHDVLMSALQAAGHFASECELLGLSTTTVLQLHCADDLVDYDYRSKKTTVRRDQGSAYRLSQARLISDQFPTTFGPLVEAASPDGTQFVTVKAHNLYLRSATDGSLRALTSDGHLRETWLNTQESAQHFNVFWSYDSRTIATVQLDTRNVWHEPLPHLLENPPRTEPVAYPRAGETIHGFRLFFIDVATGERVAINVGETQDHYVDIIGWQGDDQGLLLQILDREHKRKRIVRADRSDGSATTLLDESTKTYHDSWMTLFIDFTLPLRDSAGFLYLSEKSGWRHIEYYDGFGKHLATLTNGEWAVDRIVHVDEQAERVYFLAAMDSAKPYDLQFYSVSFNGKENPKLLSGGNGRVDVKMSPDGSHFVVRSSSPAVRPVVELRSAEGGFLLELGHFDDQPLKAAGFGGVETIAVPSARGDWNQFITILKPYGFDPTKSYPVIEHIYAGMQSVQTKHQYYGFGRTGSVGSVASSLLQAGYIVVFVDAPGTPGRGRAFQDVTYGRWPQGVIEDHVSAIQSVSATRPWMDQTRMGVYGHSWGSYMAQRAMIDAPTVYHAAVAHNGGSDFYDQPTYIEPFMGLPKNNPEGYAAASNLKRVDAINGPLLTFTAPFDVNSGFSPAFKLIDAMMAAGKDIELFVPPRNHHRIACCSADQEFYKLTKILRFFDREVKNRKTPAP